MSSTKTYIIEIGYPTKETFKIEALSEAWAKIIATEQWEAERSEPIDIINVKKDTTQ